MTFLKLSLAITAVAVLAAAPVKSSSASSLSLLTSPEFIRAGSDIVQFLVFYAPSGVGPITVQPILYNAITNNQVGKVVSCGTASSTAGIYVLTPGSYCLVQSTGTAVYGPVAGQFNMTGAGKTFANLATNVRGGIELQSSANVIYIRSELR